MDGTDTHEGLFLNIKRVTFFSFLSLSFPQLYTMHTHIYINVTLEATGLLGSKWEVGFIDHRWSWVVGIVGVHFRQAVKQVEK